MSQKKKILIKIIAFILIVAILFAGANKLFNVNNEAAERAEMSFEGFYDLEKDSVDVMVVGSSQVYAFWQNAFAWREHGLAAYSLATGGCPGIAVKHLAIEGLKYQAPQVLIINLSGFFQEDEDDNDLTKFYYLVRHMKKSKNYYEMIDEFCDSKELSFSDRLPYYIPILQFHDRWEELEKDDFVQSRPSYLNSLYENYWLNNHLDEPQEHVYTEERLPVSADREAALMDLLSWCQGQTCDILFYSAPTYRGVEDQARSNYVCDLVQAAGYAVLNFNRPEYFDALGFDSVRDFYNLGHTNINGSYMFTEYMTQYLLEHYTLSDRSGQEGYASWDKEAEEYWEKVSPYME